MHTKQSRKGGAAFFNPVILFLYLAHQKNKTFPSLFQNKKNELLAP
jgi:hypothetical protein